MTNWRIKTAKSRNTKILLLTARERYKENHPDVQRLVNLLAAARIQRQAMLRQESGRPDHPPARPLSAQFLREQREHGSGSGAD